MNIYVGNMSYSTKEEDLNDLFSQFGTVEAARIIIDRHTQRSKGFGFVEMAEDGEAEKAISELNGKEFMGRELKVNQARDKR